MLIGPNFQNCAKYFKSYFVKHVDKNESPSWTLGSLAQLVWDLSQVIFIWTYWCFSLLVAPVEAFPVHTHAENLEIPHGSCDKPLVLLPRVPFAKHLFVPILWFTLNSLSKIKLGPPGESKGCKPRMLWNTSLFLYGGSNFWTHPVWN